MEEQRRYCTSRKVLFKFLTAQRESGQDFANIFHHFLLTSALNHLDIPSAMYPKINIVSYYTLRGFPYLCNRKQKQQKVQKNLYGTISLPF